MTAIQATERLAFVQYKTANLTAEGMKIAKQNGKDGVRKWIEDFAGD